MSHTRKVCPHGTVITQCRCTSGHKITEVVRPCPFGDRHLGLVVVHPTAGGQEPAQLPAADLWGPSGTPGDPPGVTESAQGLSAGQPESFRRAVERRLGTVILNAAIAGTSPWEMDAPMAAEVGRIVVDQLLELAEALAQPVPDEVDVTVDRARLIDPAYTAERWDAARERRR